MPSLRLRIDEQSMPSLRLRGGADGGAGGFVCISLNPFLFKRIRILFYLILWNPVDIDFRTFTYLFIHVTCIDVCMHVYVYTHMRMFMTRRTTHCVYV